MIAPVIAKIVRAARESAPARLSESERELWDYYLAMQWRRVPEMHAQVMNDEAFERELSDAVAEFERRIRSMTEEERRWARNPTERPFFRSNVVVASLQSQTDGKIYQALKTRGIAVARPERRSNTFILSSRPILRAGPAGATLLHPRLRHGWLWHPMSR